MVHIVETGAAAAALAGRFEADVPGAADPAAGTIRFRTPGLDVAPAALAVLVSMDGGQTFSAPCPRRLAVRRRPAILSVEPRWASAAGGARVVVLGEHMRPDRPGRPVWIRFECGGAVKRARASPAADEGPPDFDLGELDLPYDIDFAADAAPGEAGWACTLPRMLECAGGAAGGAGPGGGLTVAVSISLDGGASWLPPPPAAPPRAGKKDGRGGRDDTAALTMVLHAPLELQPPRPGRIWRGGGAEVAVGGLGLFRTPLAAMRIVPVDGRAVPLPPSGSVPGGQGAEAAAPPRAGSPIPARLSSRPTLVATTTALNFVGEAVVEVAGSLPFPLLTCQQKRSFV